MKFDSLVRSILNEKQPQPWDDDYDEDLVDYFKTPEEIYNAIAVLEDSTVHVMDPSDKRVYTAKVDYDNKGLSLYWQQDGEDYAIDMSVQDSHNYPYSFVNNAEGRWLELQWAPGEKVLIRAKS